MPGICHLETEDSTLEKEFRDATHTDKWLLAKAIIAAVKAFDAMNPEAGGTTLAAQVANGLQPDDAKGYG